MRSCQISRSVLTPNRELESIVSMQGKKKNKTQNTHTKQTNKIKETFFFSFNSRLLNKTVNKKCSFNKSTLKASNSGCVYDFAYEIASELMREKSGKY